MQVTEISAQGLRREYKVVLPAADLASRLQDELVGIKDKVRINGFRPGKVPLSHLKRLYGRSIMGDVVQNAVNEANRKIVEDNGLRLALEPKIDLASDQAEVERAMEAEGDLSFTVAVETIPAFETGTFEDLETRAPRRRDLRRRDPALDRPARRGQSQLHPQGGRRRRGGHGRPGQDRLRRPGRRRAVRGRQGREHAARARLGQLHPGLRGPARRAQGRRGAPHRGDVPGRLRFGRSRRQGRDLRRQAARGRRPRRGEARRRFRQGLRPRRLSPHCARRSAPACRRISPAPPATG